jgi:hypothetical protein
MLYTSPWSRFELTTSVVIGTDCISSCKSNYHRSWLEGRRHDFFLIFQTCTCLKIINIWAWNHEQQELHMARCTALCDKACQWLATGRWFSPGPSVFSTNKTGRHDIAEILLKVSLNFITLRFTASDYNFGIVKLFKFFYLSWCKSNYHRSWLEGRRHDFFLIFQTCTCLKIINIWAWNHEQQELHMCQLGTTCRITGEPCMLCTHINYFVSYPTPALLL